MVYQTYKKAEIAVGMLETALDLYFTDGDGFSIIHLAAASEEVLAGLLKSEANRSLQTSREKTISALKLIHEVHHSTRKEEKEIVRSLNFVRNKTKHHDAKNDSHEILACLELEVDLALWGAIENYILYFKAPSEKALRYVNHLSRRGLGKRAIGPVAEN
jgi:hypothetical protein